MSGSVGSKGLEGPRWAGLDWDRVKFQLMTWLMATIANHTACAPLPSPAPTTTTTTAPLPANTDNYDDDDGLDDDDE